MDPIGIEENARANLEEEDRQVEKFSEIIVSVRSLSTYEGKSFRTLYPQILAACIAASFHIVVGISLAYSAIVIPQLNTNDTDTIIATADEIPWIASTLAVIAPLGGITGGFLIDYLGRLNTLKLCVIPSVIGWMTIAMATNFPMLIIGRLLTGFAASWGTSPAIVYITEIASVDIRGSLISFGPAFSSLGMVIAFLKGWILGWRVVAWCCLGYSLLPIILTQLFLLESPPWLVSKGRNEEAEKSLKWIHRNQPQPDQRPETMAELHLHLLQKEHKIKMDEKMKKGGTNSLAIKAFLKPTGYKPLLILFGLFFFQQFSGIYITLFYSVTFFEKTKSELNAYLASLLIGVVRFIMSCVNTYMLRTFYRRSLIILSGLGMAMCMFFSGLFTQWILNGTTTYTWAPTVLLLLYVTTSMIGLLPIPWTMTAELFPIEIRGVAHSIAYSMANTLMFASVQMYYVLENGFGGIVGLQWFFAVVSILASIYTFLILPETHGKKLSEITSYFAESGIFYVFRKEKKTTTTTTTINRRTTTNKKDNKNELKLNEKLLNNN